jgi:transposase
MSKGKSDQITYKLYTQSQPYLILPIIWYGWSQTINEMGIERLMSKYQTGGGASRYHPEMMTKVVVYGYMAKICSSRMLSKALKENVAFMWLSGGRPDFRTLNGFRGKVLKGVMEEVFVTAVMLRVKGYIKLEKYFVDGTKIESASGPLRRLIQNTGGCIKTIQ